MNQDVGEMMPAARHAKELGIQKMGKTGQRKPVGSFARRDSPPDTLRRHTPTNMDVLTYVNRIVVIEEVEVADMRIAGEGREQEGEVNPKRSLLDTGGAIFSELATSAEARTERDFFTYRSGDSSPGRPPLRGM